MNGRSPGSRVQFASIIALVLLLSLCPIVVAAPGDLDRTFDGDGKLLSSWGHEDIHAQAVVVQPIDQKVLIAGSALVAGDWEFALVRYCPDGALDDAAVCGGSVFGAGGKMTTDFFADWESLSALFMMPRGRFLVAGTASSDVIGGGWDNDLALVLYNKDGSLDSGFGGDGRATLDFGATDESGNALALQADGKVLVSGDSAGHLAMVRYVLTYQVYLPEVLRSASD